MCVEVAMIIYGFIVTPLAEVDEECCPGGSKTWQPGTYAACMKKAYLS
jgi:hypothetical protein